MWACASFCVWVRRVIPGGGCGCNYRPRSAPKGESRFSPVDHRCVARQRGWRSRGSREPGWRCRASWRLVGRGVGLIQTLTGRVATQGVVCLAEQSGSFGAAALLLAGERLSLEAKTRAAARETAGFRCGRKPLVPGTALQACLFLRRSSASASPVDRWSPCSAARVRARRVCVLGGGGSETGGSNDRKG